MRIIELYEDNIDLFKEPISNFFENNQESYDFFHPHELSWGPLKNIILAKSRDFYGFFINNNEIIGYGILRGWDEGFEIPSLGILINKKHQGEGYGLKVMERLHQIAKDKGAPKIRLTVLKENHSAISLYKKIGYELSEKDKNNLIGFKNL